MPPVLTKTDYDNVLRNIESIERETKLKAGPTLVEYRLAELLIMRTLGKQWWVSALKEAVAWRYAKPLEGPRKHPLSNFLTDFGAQTLETSTYGLFIGFALDVLECLEVPNSGVESKFSDLRTASFFETWFEVHSAALFARRGCDVRFVPASNKERRPDLELKFKGRTILVECKSRTKLRPEERASDEVYLKRMNSRFESIDELLSNASRKLPDPQDPYVVAVNAEYSDSKYASLEYKLLGSRIREFLIRNDNVTAVMLSRDHSMKVDGLTQFLIKVDFAVGSTARHRIPDEFYQTVVERGDLPSRTHPISFYALRH